MDLYRSLWTQMSLINFEHMKLQFGLIWMISNDAATCMFVLIWALPGRDLVAVIWQPCSPARTLQLLQPLEAARLNFECRSPSLSAFTGTFLLFNLLQDERKIQKEGGEETQGGRRRAPRGGVGRGTLTCSRFTCAGCARRRFVCQESFWIS